MPMLNYALMGKTPALIDLTRRIQDGQLDSEEEKEIMFPKKHDNPFGQYLLACLYGFGSDKVPQNPHKAQELIQSILNADSEAVSWAYNLGAFLSDKFPDKFSISENKIVFYGKAARLNNPLAYLNLANWFADPKGGNDLSESIHLLTNVYFELPSDGQVSIRRRINEIEANPNNQSNSNLLIAIGNFYKKINKASEAYFFFLKSGSSTALEHCKEYIDKASVANLIEIVKNRASEMKMIQTELEKEKIPNKLDEIEYSKRISATLSGNIQYIGYEFDLINGRFSKQNNFKQSELGKLITAAEKHITEIKQLLKERDEAIESIQNQLRETQDMAQDKEIKIADLQNQNRELKQLGKALLNENEKLKREIKELKQAATSTSPESGEEVFTSRFGFSKNK